MSLKIEKAKVVVSIEMDYIDSHYVIRNHKHIEKFFKEIDALKDRYEALVRDPENSNYKPINSKTLKVEYLIDGEWTKSN